MKFTKPKRNDTWGNVTLSWRGMAQVPAKGRARIRWPDGHEEVVTLHEQKLTVDVSDMGHRYTVESSIPSFTVKVHGVSVCFALDKVRVGELLP